MEMQIRRVTYETIDVDRDELMTLTDAAKMLGISIPGLRSAMDRGQFTEYVDPDALTTKHRRFVLRAEVEAETERRARAAEKWAPA